MGKVTNALLGVSPAAVIAGLRQGLQEFKVVTSETTARICPLESASLASIPARSFLDVIGPRKATITVDLQAYESGMLTWRESVALLSLITLAQPRVVLEIGTFMGYTAKAIASTLPEAIVHTLDLPLDFNAAVDPVTGIPKDDFHLISGRQPGREFINTPEAARIRQHFGDSATWDYSQAAGANCFFIDGSHTYEYCKIDSEKCYELCDGKGLFIWHDCNDGHPGVVRCLNEWRAHGREIIRIKETALAYWNGL